MESDSSGYPLVFLKKFQSTPKTITTTSGRGVWYSQTCFHEAEKWRNPLDSFTVSSDSVNDPDEFILVSKTLVGESCETGWRCRGLLGEEVIPEILRWLRAAYQCVALGL